MSFADALIYSLLGMSVVFFALVLLMCIIKLMTFFGDRAERRAAAIPAPNPAGEILIIPRGPAAPGSAGELKLYDTDPRTAAMLMAIVADNLQVPLNELRFLSIREIKEDKEK